MALWQQALWCYVATALALNLCYWLLWRPVLTGRFDVTGNPEGWWVGFAGPFSHEDAVEFSLSLPDHDLPYLVDANGEPVPGMRPCTICRSMCMDPGGIHLTPAWMLEEA